MPHSGFPNQDHHQEGLVLPKGPQPMLFGHNLADNDITNAGLRYLFKNQFPQLIDLSIC